MSLRAKYKLRTPAAQGAMAFDQLIEGEEAATGRPVSIHILAGGSSLENRTLLKEIEELPREYKIVFLEIGEQDGNPFIVTDALSGAPPFRKWFTSLKAKLGASAKGSAKTDSTDLLKHSAWQIPVQVNAPAPPVLKTPIPTSSPGEFTRMFQVAGPPEKESPSATPPPPVKATPGEFTQMFQAQAVASPEAIGALSDTPPDSRPAPPAPGEFTQLFRASIPEGAPRVSTEPERQGAVSDEFNQLFGSPTAPAAANAPGEFTQLFQAPVVAPAPVAQPVPAAMQPDPDATLIFQATSPPSPKPQPAAQGPGEFTRMFAGPQRPAASHSPSPAAFDALFHQGQTPDEFPGAPPAPTSAAQPGEFTRMLESPLARSGLKPQNPVAPPPERFSMKGQSSGFTQMMESPVSPHSDMPSTPAPSPQKKASGEATRAFRFPEAPQTPPPAPGPPPPAGPSEFTQMFKAPAKKEEPKPEKPAARPSRVKPRRKPNNANLKWILAVSALLLIIAIVVFFAVRD